MKKSFSSFKKILISIFITSLCVFFSTSCLLDALLGDSNSTDNQDQTHQDYGGDENLPNLPGEHTDPNYMTRDVARINFDNDNIQFNYTDARITKDEFFAQWNNNTSRAKGALTDYHGNVLRLEGNPRQLKYGSEGSKIFFDVFIRESSQLTFEYRSDIYYDNQLKVQITKKGNGGSKTWTINSKGYGEEWNRASIEIPYLGDIRITIKLPKQSGVSTLKNLIYLDNITVAPNKVEFIDIYPKGLQETYVGGNPIKFTTFALRGDRTVIENLPLQYSVSGEGRGTIDSNGIFRPTAPGQCTLSVTINGKTVNKENILIHGEDYLLDPVKLGTFEFKGNRIKYKITYKDRNVNSNIPNSLSTDGFFVIEGNTDTPLLVEVVSNQYNNLKTYFIIRKPQDFKRRIWLRFGNGDYTVNIHRDPNMKFYDTGDTRYEGDFESGLLGDVIKSFRVTNNNSLTTEEALYLLPSELIQSDDFIISNVAHSLAAQLPKNVSYADILRRIHDALIQEITYDRSILINSKERKRQDAIHTLVYEMGVCEGYANLFGAISRALGIQVKGIGSESLNHAWNQVKYNGKWYLVDVTWDDPFYSDVGKELNKQNYKYFMTGLKDSEHTDAGKPDWGRSIETDRIPSVIGMPDGYY